MRHLTCIAAAVVVASALAAPALAQQASDRQTAEGSAAALVAEDLREFDDMEVPRLGISVERLEDMDVIGPDGEEIGEVEEVLIDANGRIAAVSIEAGGFLGLGDFEAIVGIDQLALEADRDQLVLSITAEELRALPEWDD